MQETHYWHCQAIGDTAKAALDPCRTVVIAGDERSSVPNNRVFPFPMFHAPVLGGWRKYALLRVDSAAEHWHIGWVHRAVPLGARPRAHVQALPIAEREIRILRQAVGYVTEFFAVAPAGEQLSLHLVAEGELGDRRFPHARLF
ncbi:MAG TPA: hypothetical protein VGD62_01800 [Acidobacteriaceae bacterium]